MSRSSTRARCGDQRSSCAAWPTCATHTAGCCRGATSQAGRAERSLSWATRVRLAAALGMTVDDLLRGEDPAAYQIGRRTGDPRLEPEATEALLSGGDGRPSVDLIRLPPREYCA